MNIHRSPEHEGRRQLEASASGLKQIRVAIDALTNELKATRSEQASWRARDKWPKRTGVAVIAYTALTFVLMALSAWQGYLIRSNNVVSQRAIVSAAFRTGVPVWSGTPNKLTTKAILDSVTLGSTPAAARLSLT
jgi:hypothetical protein